MTLVSEIVKDAYRESNLIAIGDVPSADQLEEALALLNRLRLSVLGTEAGEQLDPIPIGNENIERPAGFPWYGQTPANGNWYVPSNSRLYLNLTASQEVFLNPQPLDGARFAFIDKAANLSSFNLTVNANGRTIAGSTTATFNTDSQAQEYIYRADLGDWLLVDPLVSTDTWPFPEEFDDFFVIGLALRLNPRYIIQTAPETVEQYKRLRTMFKARYRQSQVVGSELGLVRTPNARGNRYVDDTYYAASAFASGYPYLYGYRFYW